VADIRGTIAQGLECPWKGKLLEDLYQYTARVPWVAAHRRRMPR